MNKNKYGEVSPKPEKGPRDQQKGKEPKKEIMKMREKGTVRGGRKGPEGENYTGTYLQLPVWHCKA